MIHLFFSGVALLCLYIAIEAHQMLASLIMLCIVIVLNVKQRAKKQTKESEQGE